MFHVEQLEARHQQAGLAQALARGMLVAAKLSRFYRMREEAERGARARGSRSRTITDGDDRLDLVGPRVLDQLGGGQLRLVELQRQRVVAPRIVEPLAAVAGEDDLQVQLL